MQLIGPWNGQGYVVAWIQQMMEWYFKGLSHFILAQGELIIGGNQPQHRQHIVLGNGVEGGQGTDDLDLSRYDAQLLQVSRNAVWIRL